MKPFYFPYRSELKTNNVPATFFISLLFLFLLNQKTFSQTLSVTARTVGAVRGETTPAVNTVADVAIVKVGPASAKPGDIVTYKLEITNVGPASVDGAVVANGYSDKFTIRSITASSISCASSLTVAPDEKDLTAQKLEGTGIVIPHLPAGGAINLLITGVAESGIINSTATVSLPATVSDPNPGNNLDTYVTNVFSPEVLTTYELDIDETLRLAGDMNAGGGSFNLIYKLTAGTAIKSLGEILQIPLTYSSLNNTATGAVNNWDKLSKTSLGLNLGVDPVSLFIDLPSGNINEFPEIKPVTSTDILFSKYLTDGTLQLLGTAYMTVGIVPVPAESNVKMVEESIVLWQAGNLYIERPPNLYRAGFWIHQLGNTGLNTISDLARSVTDTVRHNATYPLVYSAYSFDPSKVYLTGPDRGAKVASGKIVFSTSSTLPLTLLSFEAKKINSIVQLNWATTSEKNAQSFGVERSTDGVHFEVIGNIIATNNNGIHAYNFADRAPLNGSNIYRLKMNDIDGKFTYSPSKAVVFNASSAISVFPNPVIDKLHIRNAGIGAVLSLADVSGRILLQQKIKTADQSFEMSKYAPGMYIIHIKENTGQTYSMKVVKQ